jgi:hypothetical protein
VTAPARTPRTKTRTKNRCGRAKTAVGTTAGYRAGDEQILAGPVDWTRLAICTVIGADPLREPTKISRESRSFRRRNYTVAPRRS